MSMPSPSSTYNGKVWKDRAVPEQVSEADLLAAALRFAVQAPIKGVPSHLFLLSSHIRACLLSHNLASQLDSTCEPQESPELL